MIKITDLARLKEFGFVYRDSYHRGVVYKGDFWVREDENNPGDGIIVYGGWAGNEVSYLHPYKHIDYPPIENYIQDLFAAGIAVKE